jgi:hypothetical protein
MTIDDTLDRIIAALGEIRTTLDGQTALLTARGEALASINTGLTNIHLRLEHLLARLEAFGERLENWSRPGGSSDTGPQESL